MTNPSIEEVVSLSREYNLIPVVTRLLADMETPIRLFQRFAEQDRAFLLESVEGGIQWARYSFIGSDPFLMISGKKGKIQVEVGGEKKQLSGKPVEELKALLRSYRSPKLDGMPPFTGGAIGFFGYDLLQYYEKLSAHAVDDLNMDDIRFMFCDRIIVFDHVKQQILLVGNLHIKDGDTDSDIRANYEELSNRLVSLAEELQKEGPKENVNRRSIPQDIELGEIHSNLTKEQYISNVEQAKEYIRAGDIFQVVLSQRMHIETEVSPLHVYRMLRILNPSPICII